MTRRKVANAPRRGLVPGCNLVPLLFFSLSYLATTPSHPSAFSHVTHFPKNKISVYRVGFSTRRGGHDETCIAVAIDESGAYQTRPGQRCRAGDRDAKPSPPHACSVARSFPRRDDVPQFAITTTPTSTSSIPVPKPPWSTPPVHRRRRLGQDSVIGRCRRCTSQLLHDHHHHHDDPDNHTISRGHRREIRFGHPSPATPLLHRLNLLSCRRPARPRRH